MQTKKTSLLSGLDCLMTVFYLVFKIIVEQPDGAHKPCQNNLM